ncbi:alpha/beta hydrolase [Gordonia rubripertincta]|uniref:Alpha/beta hydrolase n=2 Tax=Gordonia rubripertincta TaxID=36822 RepID=A0AAW6RCI1_GORRU|nr:alpha/beta hydrolase [Gordonia rubripertincta]MDG6783684.1 alpha/beta hydrolase [Gordonia rubripertincta]NKY65758.1 alpha/beta hydrolase [Gordonia rubripertincta]GAB84101.1 putative esterase [Gordonia rubripertincta NBRC 101908]
MNDVIVKTDLTIATIDGFEVAADLYRPSGEAPPLVIYIHGGGWQLGDKADGASERLEGLASHGVAVLSVNYRLAPKAAFPNPIHDVKAAVRWARANAASLDVDGDRIGIWGASAGAYLATMVGLSDRDTDLEGDVGGNQDQSSRVDAVVHWFGPSDLSANSRRSPVESFLLPPPFETAILGESEVEAPTAASWNASPLSRVHRAAPPFLIAHGDRDRITPIEQSRHLHDALVAAGADSTFTVLGGAGHEGREFDSTANLAQTAAFLRAHLTPRD